MRILVAAIIVSVIFSSQIFAHPGNTDAGGCHQCSACTPYGSLYEYGNRLYPYYHCHIAELGQPPIYDDGQSIGDILDRITPRSDSVVVPPVKPKPTIDTAWMNELNNNLQEMRNTPIIDPEVQRLHEENQNTLQRLKDILDKAKISPTPYPTIRRLKITFYPTAIATSIPTFVPTVTNTPPIIPSPTPQDENANILRSKLGWSVLATAIIFFGLKTLGIIIRRL